MLKFILKVTLGLLLFSTAVLAGDDIPLAVTTTTHPSLLTTPTQAQLEKSDDYLKAGLVFMEKQNYARAVAEFEDSVRQAPRAKNFKALGTAYFNLGDKQRAAEAYRESLQLEADPKVSALVDSLEGREDKEGQFANKADELRYSKLVKDGAQMEKKGKRDKAFQYFHEAYGLKPDSLSREKLGNLGIRLAEDHLKARSYETSAAYCSKLRVVYRRARDLSQKEFEDLKRLDAVEIQLAKGAGEKGRTIEKAMETERERKGKGPKKFKVEAEGEY
jgi:tetratricopeptide (TPR) repeat protein